MSTLRIAIDAMGGDLGVGEVVDGVIQAAHERPSASLILVGDKDSIQKELKRQAPAPPSITVHHASQIIEMTDKPREAFRKKPDASVVVASRLVKNNEADAFISIGNTGAAMASAIFLLRPIAGIDRPAIATPLPSLKGTVVLLDAGANVDCSPRQLLEFAQMGEVYSRVVIGIQNPRVGLLSNGEEPSKGNDLTRDAHLLLKEHLPAFVGNIEGTHVFRGAVDVVVCDGFDGNIVLKVGEGVAEMVMDMIKQELTRHSWMRFLLLPFRNSIRGLRDRLDYREFGGAPLLGVNGVCIIGHGRSDARAVANAVRAAETAVENELVSAIKQAVCPQQGAAPSTLDGTQTPEPFITRGEIA